MATLATYYFDTASFTNATTIYDDANLTTISQNGWYSDDSIVRQQISGVLMAAQSCSIPTPVPTPTAPIPVPAPVSPTPVPSPVPSPAPVPAPVAPSPVPSPVAPSPVPTAPVPAPVYVPQPVPVPVAPVPAPVAPSPVPAPVVQCYAISLQKGSYVCSGSYSVHYFDASSLSAATTAYANSSCNSNASAGYYRQGLSYRYWNGSSFTSSGSC